MPKKVTPETEEQRQARETVEKIASNIAALAKSVNSLLNGPLKRKALIILLAHSAGQPQNAVEAILKALSELEGDWLQQKN